MANVNGLVSVETVDAYGIPATTLYNVVIDDTKTIAQLVTDAHGLQSAQATLTAGSQTRTKVELVIDGVGGVAAGDIEKGGLFNFSNATDSYATGIYVPDIAPAVLNAQGLIDLTNVNVQAFITFLTTAHTTLTIVTKGVRALTALKDALIAFRKHRKPLARKTKEL